LRNYGSFVRRRVLIVVVVSGTFDLTPSGGQAISTLAEMVTVKEMSTRWVV
jgi:hypothetical protein